LRLLLDATDLKPKHQMAIRDHSVVDQAIVLRTSEITFEHLNEDAQAVLRIVGRGTFFTWSGDNYQALVPPSE